MDYSAAPILVPDGQPLGAVLVFHDVTDQRRLANELAHRATHDALTGLINRSKFERFLNSLFHSATELNKHHALMFLDLDQFKVINDSCGHSAGDVLLQRVAALMQNCLRHSDTLARLGGDEFAVLLDNCSLDGAAQIAQKILDSINHFNFIWEDKAFSIGVSIGVVPIDQHSPGIARLLNQADAACYTAKTRGRNRIHLSSHDDAEVIQRREETSMVAILKRALAQDRFQLYTQDIVPVNGHCGDIVYRELLLRMIDEDDKLIQPGQFIPVAERYYLMQSLDRWVIRQAFASMADAPGPDNIRYTINISGQSLDDEEFHRFVKEQLKHYKVTPQLICFEITETAAFSHLTDAIHFISELKSIGCQFVIDDFGAGVTSFSTLKNLPTDYLKIDGTFVKNLLHNQVDRTMVEAINHVGHVMGLKTIAEHVETPELLQELKRIGIDFVQGYHIGKPAPIGVKSDS